MAAAPSGVRAASHTEKLPARIVVWAAIAFGVLALVSLRYPPRLGSDFMQLLTGWDYYQRTGAFNQTALLNPVDIARDQTIFATWWSPGPVVVTGVFELVGMPIGVALSFWLAVAATIQIWGLRKLYDELGFDSLTVTFSLISVAASWHTLYSFRLFTGGELLAAACFPWAGVALLRAPGRPSWQIIAVAGAVLLGGLIKLSLVVAIVALCLAIIAAEVVPNAGSRDARSGLRRALWPRALGCALGGVLLQVLFLSKGITPATSWPVEKSFVTLLHAFGMSAVLPLWSVFALVSMSGRALDAVGLPHLEGNPILLSLMVPVSLLIFFFTLRGSSPRVRVFVTAFGVIYVLVFTKFYFTGAAISYEDRLFRPVGLLLLPVLVSYVRSGPLKSLRVALGGFLAAAALWGVASYVHNLADLIRTDRVSARRYALAEIPPAVEQALRRADAALFTGNNLFVVGSLEAELAIHHNRVTFTEWNASTGEFHGQVDHLILMLPSKDSAEPWLRRFVDYSATGWQHTAIAGWTFYWQGANFQLLP